MKNEHIHNQNHSINLDADGPYRRVLSGLAYMVSVAGKISGTDVFLCTGGGVPTYKKSKEISAAWQMSEWYFLIRLCVCCRENWTMWRINRKIIIYLQPCFAPACLSVYGKTGKRRKSFLHTLGYISSGRLW